LGVKTQRLPLLPASPIRDSQIIGQSEMLTCHKVVAGSTDIQSQLRANITHNSPLYEMLKTVSFLDVEYLLILMKGRRPQDGLGGIEHRGGGMRWINN
jgi:hypothetical protein